MRLPHGKSRGIPGCLRMLAGGLLAVVFAFQAIEGPACLRALVSAYDADSSLHERHKTVNLDWVDAEPVGWLQGEFEEQEESDAARLESLPAARVEFGALSATGRLRVVDSVARSGWTARFLCAQLQI